MAIVANTATAGDVQARARIYAFLGGVFSSHPTPDRVHAVRQLAAELGIACPNSFSLSELDQEYMELFVVPNPRYVAPYESVFRDQWLLPPVLRRGSNPAETGPTIKGLLMGESTLKVRRFYLQAGLLPEHDLPDHLANELRFLAYMWARQAEAPAEEIPALAELREKFCREHVLKWIGDLREKIERNDQLGYYRAALQVAETILQEDAER